MSQIRKQVKLKFKNNFEKSLNIVFKTLFDTNSEEGKLAQVALSIITCGCCENIVKFSFKLKIKIQ